MAMRCVIVTADGTSERQCEVEDMATADHAAGFGWIDLRDPDLAELGVVREILGVHQLAVEDVAEAGQRSKVERYDGDLTFVVLKDVVYEPTREGLRMFEVHLIVGPWFVVTISRGGSQVVDGVRADAARAPLREPLAVLHAVMDRVVDGQVAALHMIDKEVQDVERRVFSRDNVDDLAPEIYELKRDVLEVWHDTEPLAESLESLVRRLEDTGPGWAPYFRDVADHLRHVISRLERMRELLTDAQDANLARLGVRQNDDMRKISAWGALFLLPTVLVGVWGMNFEHMPEVDERWGYPAALALIASCCAALYWRLRRSGWL